MSEIKKELLKLAPNETYTADEDGALVITDVHTHSDILRYVVKDLGLEETKFILDFL